MKNKKDILILMASFAGGGAEKVMIDLLRRFDVSRYNITVAVLWGYGPHLASVPDDVELIMLYNRAPNFFDNKTRSWRFLHNPLWRHRLLKALGDRHFDVTISFMEGQTALLHSYIMDRARVNISWIHSDIYNCWWYRFLMTRKQERAIYSRMDAVVCVSEGVRAAFRKAVDDLDNLHVIYNIIDRDYIIRKADEFSVSHDCFTIINMARLQPEKCQHRIIRVASILKKKGLEFKVRLLGAGKLEAELKQLADSLDIADRVEFLGFQPNPYPYIKSSDIFLLTSDAEGFSLALCEAICLDKPVISTRTAGPMELLGEHTGVLTGNDPAEIAAVLEEFMTDKERMQHYCRQSHMKAETFAPEDVMRRIEKLWEERL
ncbi:MAG: glycosyltransferase [Muribaculaceae bacterium]|nr:glycosyltransferase [Muribaculaceae bacterium]